MTENEAKTKWCPQTQVAASATSGDRSITEHKYISNRTPYEHSRCVASECMAWRWKLPHRDPPPEGYCGLAGTP